MDSFNVLKSEKFNVGKIQKQRINITNKIKGKPLKQKDIKEIVNQINAKYIRDKDKTPKILVRGMSEIGVWTIKSYEDTIVAMFDDEDDYFAGRITDTGKFQQFDQIEISLYA
jgi:predicted transcriptional regulator